MGVQTHDDAVAIIVNYNVRRILIDNGSSANVLFYDTLVKMNISCD